jgi:hypothetical protein
VLDAWTAANHATTTFDSSSRFQGLGRNRASSAFDGDQRRSWIAGWIGSRGAWLRWRTRAPRTIRTLRLERAPVRVRFPTRVRVVADGRPTAPLAVAADGSVALPAPVRARCASGSRTRLPRGTPGIDRKRRARRGGGERRRGPARHRAARRRRALRLGCGDGPASSTSARGRAPARGATADTSTPAARCATACGAVRATAPLTVRAGRAVAPGPDARHTSPAAATTPVAGGRSA